jgi:hypothetical protein
VVVTAIFRGGLWEGFEAEPSARVFQLTDASLRSLSWGGAVAGTPQRGRGSGMASARKGRQPRHGGRPDEVEVPSSER